MWVRVESCEWQNRWYFNHIGIEVEVEDNTDQYYSVIEEEPEKPWITYLIEKSDAVEIEVNN